VPMDADPAMQLVWEPGDLALKQLLRGAAPAEAALAASRRYEAISKPSGETGPPEEADPLPWLVLLGLATVIALALGGRAFARSRTQPRDPSGPAPPRPLAWVAPAVVATAILVMVPFGVGLVLAFFHHDAGSWTFVGASNFVDILGSRHFGVFEPLSFYYALLVTVLWTAINVAIHVGLGFGLALLLNRPLAGLRPFYRVVLILPWAVPSYITALMWKGLFHTQFGAINGLLEALGLSGIPWFDSFGTAFFANTCANAWLGFPFMMVISLGALQAIPKDLLEAAAVDGASAWQRFRHITLPLVRPALVPAILLGVVWTFNQFNIIWLVSGGAPDNSTDILISEAYRWAFARREQYGYAAAYAAIIFVILLVWARYSMRVSRRLEEGGAPPRAKAARAEAGA
jgi:arabinogalactan oligomer/maltooligosaccharide transport system permease protein